MKSLKWKFLKYIKFIDDDNFMLTDTVHGQSGTKYSINIIREFTKDIDTTSEEYAKIDNDEFILEY